MTDPETLPCQRIDPLSGGSCGMGPNSPAHGARGSHDYTARDRRNRDRRAEDDRDPARHPNRAMPTDPETHVHGQPVCVHPEFGTMFWVCPWRVMGEGGPEAYAASLAFDEGSDDFVRSFLANTEPVSPDGAS